jgi:hypothetical protein
MKGLPVWDLELLGLLRIAGETFFELSQSLRHYRVSCGLFDTNLLRLIDEKDRESQLNNPSSARSWRV